MSTLLYCRIGKAMDGMEWNGCIPPFLHFDFFFFFFEFSFTRGLMATTFHCICDDVVVVNYGL